MPRLTSDTIDQCAKSQARNSIANKLNAVRINAVADSRTADMYVTAGRKNGRSWINWANAYMGQTMEVVANYAQAGKRSDEWLSEANFAPMLTDGSTLSIVGYPFVNDFAQAVAGYVDTDGQAVNMGNVIDYAMKRLHNRVDRLVESGRQVVVSTEPGANNFTAAQVALVHEVNARIRAEFGNSYRITVFDPTDVIWSRATTATSIVIKTGFTGDGMHATTRQGQVVGKYGSDVLFPSIVFRRKSYGVDLRTSSANLFANVGYATLTGGTTANITGTDPVPLNCQLAATAAGIASYTLTSADAADGSGKELTLTVTATAAVQIRFMHINIPTAGLGYTDKFVAGVDVDVINSDTAFVYWDTQIFTVQGTQDGYDMYSGDVGNVWVAGIGATGPLRMQSDPVSAIAGSSTGLAPQGRLIVDFKAAGTCQLKIKDPTFYRK